MLFILIKINYAIFNWYRIIIQNSLTYFKTYKYIAMRKKLWMFRPRFDMASDVAMITIIIVWSSCTLQSWAQLMLAGKSVRHPAHNIMTANK